MWRAHGTFDCGDVRGLIWIGTGPEGGEKLSNELESYATEYLERHGVLNDSETLIAYYDATISLDSTEAAILRELARQLPTTGRCL